RGVPACKIALASLAVRPTVSVALEIKFQLASTALTVTVKGTAAFWAAGVPVFPVALPGEADSPGTNNCNRAKVPTLTVSTGLVLAATPAWVVSEAVSVAVPAVLDGSDTSDAVRVAVPAVISVTLGVTEPPTRAASEGRMALVSDELRSTVSVTLHTRFQKASTALTVALKAAPAVCARGEPV